MNRRNVAAVALVGAFAGCGSAHDPHATSRLTQGEVRAVLRTHSALSAYCSASVRLESIAAGDARASLRAGDGLAEQYGATTAAFEHYEVVLRAHPDARPPSDDHAMDASPRQDAEELVDDALADCSTSAAKEAATRWRARLHTVLATLPPARSE